MSRFTFRMWKTLEAAGSLKVQTAEITSYMLFPSRGITCMYLTFVETYLIH